MAKAKRASKSYASYYAQYKSTQRWRTNRERRLKQLLKSQPNNQQIVQALKDVKYRRCTPKSEFWSRGNIYMAQLFKQFTGRAPLALFSSNQKTVQQALQTAVPLASKPGSDRVSFSLAARAHDGHGSPIWK